MQHDPNCLFCKIVEGKIPSKKVHEDEELLVFHDINPWAPVHFLMVPKEHIPSMAQGKAAGRIRKAGSGWWSTRATTAARRFITSTCTSSAVRALGNGAEV